MYLKVQIVWFYCTMRSYFLCITFLLHNELLPNITAWNNKYLLFQSLCGSEIGGLAGWLWLKVCHEIVGKLSSRAAVVQRLRWGWRIQYKFTHMVFSGFSSFACHIIWASWKPKNFWKVRRVKWHSNIWKRGLQIWQMQGNFQNQDLPTGAVSGHLGSLWKIYQ